MIRKEIKFVVIALMIILLPSILAIPHSLTLNGKLTDSSGTILSGDYNMTFRFYSDYTGGSPMLTIANQSVSVGSDGIYHALLQDINLTFVNPTYLGITVRTDSEMSPRINLTSSPYSFRSNVTENLNASNNYELENLTANGGIGIGTSAHPNLVDLYNGGMAITSPITFGGTAPTYGLMTEGPIWIGGTGGLGELDIVETSPLDEATIRLSNADVGSSSTDGYLMSMYTNTMFKQWLYENLPMVFATNNLERFRIEAGGLVNVTGNQLIQGDLNVTGISYLGDIIINSNNITTDNLVNRTSSNITFWSNFFPAFDNLLDLGSSSFRWKDLFLGGQVYSNGTGDNYFLGNVGIGTSNPTHLLNVFGNTNLSGNVTLGNSTVFIQSDGSVGIGTHPSVELDVSGDSIFDGYFTIKDIFGANILYADHNTGDVRAYNDLRVDGNVGIGTSISSYTLDVNGNARVIGNFGCEGLTSLSIHNTGNVLVDDSIGIGTSTPSQKLEVAGNVNISNGGNLSVNGAITSNMTKISAYKSSNQNINDITTTSILFDTENYDTLGEFASSKFTCTQAGYYEIYTHIMGEALGGGHQWNLYIYKNGNPAARSRLIMPSAGAAGDNPTLDVRKTLYLEPDDYIQVYVYQENGNTRTIYSGDDDTYLEIRRVV